MEEIIAEYKAEMYRFIMEGQLDVARELATTFHELPCELDSDLSYLEASLCYLEGYYALALYWARLGYSMEAEHEGICEILSLLEDNFDKDHYDKKAEQKLCSYHKQLTVLMLDDYLAPLDFFFEQLKDALIRLGHNVIECSIKDIATGKSSCAAIFNKYQIDFALIYNNLGLKLYTNRGENAWDYLNIPIFNLLVDTPGFYIEDLLNAPKVCAPLCIDQKHVEFINKYMPNIKETYFLPHGGTEQLDRDIPWEERPIDVLYLGGCKNHLGEKEDWFCNIVIDYLKEIQYAHTTEEAIVYCYRQLKEEQKRAICSLIDWEESEDTSKKFELKLIDYYMFCDVLLTGKIRVAAVKSLLDAGIDVTVHGNWTHSGLVEYKHFHQGEFLTDSECLREMKRAKIVLNHTPNFKAGGHERIYNAMLSKAVCVTDKNVYLDNCFQDGKELFFYTYHELEKLPDLVQKILDNPEKSAKIAEDGYQSVVLQHTWQNRGLEILTDFYRLD